MELHLFDTIGNEIKLGDMLKIGRNLRSGDTPLSFYARCQVVNNQLYPFNKFSFDWIVKVEDVPEGCVHCSEKQDFPEYWIDKKQYNNLVKNDLQDWFLDQIRFTDSLFFKVSE